MTKSKQITAVFLELSQTIGDSFNTRELLEMAKAWVEFSSPLNKEGPKVRGFQWRERPPSFEELDLSLAMADGGWRIMYHEYPNNCMFDDR